MCLLHPLVPWYNGLCISYGFKKISLKFMLIKYFKGEILHLNTMSLNVRFGLFPKIYQSFWSDVSLKYKGVKNLRNYLAGTTDDGKASRHMELPVHVRVSDISTIIQLCVSLSVVVWNVCWQSP